MFGPDKCGSSNARTHVIFNYPPKGDDSNLLVKKDVKMEKDQASHVYTLHVKADGTFEVSVKVGKKTDSPLCPSWCVSYSSMFNWSYSEEMLLPRNCVCRHFCLSSQRMFL